MHVFSAFFCNFWSPDKKRIKVMPAGFFKQTNLLRNVGCCWNAFYWCIFPVTNVGSALLGWACSIHCKMLRGICKRAALLGLLLAKGLLGAPGLHTELLHVRMADACQTEGPGGYGGCCITTLGNSVVSLL